MRWAVQYFGAGRRWKRIEETERASRDEAVALLKEWREEDPGHKHRLVRLVTKSEKLRAAIVKELRTIAEEQSAYANINTACIHSSKTLSAVADRIDRGEVG